jgi:TPR repeat protein
VSRKRPPFPAAAAAASAACRRAPRSSGRGGQISPARPITIAAALAIVIAAAAPALAGPYEDGIAALSAGDFAAALKLWQPLADSGNALAQSQIGVLYLNGRGVKQDYAEALAWLNRAAAQGEGNAEFNLGAIYHDGTGVPRDDARADRWYELAADQGLVPAQGNLGFMVATGQGVPVDYAVALKWFMLAAAGGDSTAAENGAVAASHLAPAEIAAVEREVRQWKPAQRRPPPAALTSPEP